MAVTQTEHPWRATLRTLFAALIAFAGMWAFVVEALNLDPNLQWVTVSLAITAGVNRVMLLPAVNEFIKRFLPWLAAAPPAYEGKHEA